MKGNRGTYRRFIRLFWIVFSIGILSFVSIFLAAGFGFLGKMPEFRQLENPKQTLLHRFFQLTIRSLGSFITMTIEHPCTMKRFPRILSML